MYSPEIFKKVTSLILSEGQNRETLLTSAQTFSLSLSLSISLYLSLSYSIYLSIYL